MTKYIIFKHDDEFEQHGNELHITKCICIFINSISGSRDMEMLCFKEIFCILKQILNSRFQSHKKQAMHTQTQNNLFV